jgi:NodT family efflux transporter outer membrane factor (OMF) lipoprotein
VTRVRARSRPAGAPASTRAVFVVAALAAALAGCVAGPDYARPPVETPPAWKLEAPWREGTPDDAAPKGPWWQRFGDARLDALQAQALAQSPTLALANARLAQARAVVAATSAGQWPTVNLNARGLRQRISANRPLSNYASPNFSTVQNDGVVLLSVNYEFDLAGRVQRTVEGAQASAEQAAADFENTRLLLGTDLATAYFNLRAIDIELDVLARSIALQRRSLEFVRTRHDLGAASGLDVAQQQALLDTTLTQLDVVRRQRGPFEHAVATLTGTPAPSFSLVADIRELTPPTVPLGVPSDVLERRPDVASAERAMAAANAQIGVATAAYYPSITITPNLGYESRMLANLFSAPSALWAIGAQFTQPLFSAGRIDANVEYARANYDATVASYRRVVLTAMQEVEDGITSLSALESADRQSRTAVQTARLVLELATARYEGGATTYLDVITAQQALLSAERLSAQLSGQRLLTSVFLIKALGGDWDPPAPAAGS